MKLTKKYSKCVLNHNSSRSLNRSERQKLKDKAIKSIQKFTRK